ncbi:ricin-type beta-trefoil lectin domain protein [Streptomyces sp. TS71-3]|uniref:ricin-type beta-trefoil lectin domain protein n=1 Tax=Streptomyces sp. TS71-3 TaxID=2733862 RepID=UPI001B1A65A7|nr:family 16 glycosylhydrolase [Streptomyces sp. TS71-3]GHJ41374.1 hydrolase [Streptomyces sp. TS71-3]
MRDPWRRRLVVWATAVLCLSGALVPAASAAGAAPAAPHTARAAASPALQAAFTEDFDGSAGSAVNGSRWTQETGDNSGNNHERQYYTAGNANAALDGQGHLVITARRENPGNYNCWYGRCEYTSARMNTAGKISAQYGHIETRMKIPRGQGMWPAFWMLGNGGGGWPAQGEIDIMENIGKEPGTVHGTIHGPGYSGSGGIGAGYSLPGGQAFADNFHTFAIDWAPNSIKWSVDGNVYQTRTPADVGGNQWVFNKSFFIILNLAVGGDWPGNPDGGTSFPQQLVVDYVHVSTSDGGSGGGGTIKGLGGKCVDVAGASAANGTPVQLYDCNGTAAQQWSVNGDTLRSLGKCLDVVGSSTADGAKVQLWDCTGGGNQRWTVNASTHDIVNLQANKCLDVTDNNSANSTRLQIWTCTGAANQKWTMS